MIQKQKEKSLSNGDDNHQNDKFLLEILPIIIMNPLALKLIKKFKTNLPSNHFSSIKTKINQDLNFNLIQQFNRSFFQIIIGSNDDDFCRWNQIKFDNEINRIHQHFRQHLMDKQRLEQLKQSNIQKLETIIELIENFLHNNQSIRSNVMVILNEKQCEYEIAKQKFYQQKELNNIQQLLMKSNEDHHDHDNNLRQQYRTIIIENQLLQRKIEKFQLIKQKLEMMDRRKLDHIRHLQQKINFLQELNETLPSTSISSPIMNHDQQQQQQTPTNAMRSFFIDHHEISPSIILYNDHHDDSDNDNDNISLSFDAQLKF
ncbi:uncharacterized protein LOC142645198 isoform X2 [Dermatophagoides pteronyssinus]|uniref:uncharacterized protein LOC142645198 isoform X2 n=1 Tax=Dermatophagoides pteronyssinus TaxID=6956 RepID=UPI003F673F00